MKLGHIAVTGIVAAVLAASASAVSLAVASPGAQSADATVHENDTLRGLAARVGLRIGNAVNMDVLGSDAQYTEIAGSQFSSSTPENVMKWQPVEPTQGVYNWTPADNLVTFAQQHGQRVRGHTLVWHNQLPTWLTGGTFTNDQLRDLLHKHITDEVTHFRGKIWQWDVVNEAINDDGTMRSTIWSRALGPDYIADAFRWAHAADPKALLFYNDYNIEGFGAKSDTAYAMVKNLLAEGVPINGVGIQGHLDTQYPLPSRMTQNVQRFDALGLDTAFTEVDVRTFVPVTTQELLAQSEDYTAMLQACLAARGCISFTVWGFTDKYSWVPGFFTGEGAACIYDENYQKKPEYDAVAQTLALAGGAPIRHRG
jgi:endo-1,4-beta-xylanase